MSIIRMFNEVPTGNPPAGYTYIFVNPVNNHITTRDENGANFDLTEGLAGTQYKIITNADSPYTVLADDFTFFVNTTAGNVIFDLPTAVGIGGKSYRFVAWTMPSGSFLVSGEEDIDGLSSISTSTEHHVIDIQSNDTDWSITQQTQIETGVNYEKKINVTGDIVAMTAINVNASGVNYTVTGDTLSLGISEAIFNANKNLQIFYNGIMQEKGTDILWDTEFTFKFIMDLDNLDLFIILF